MSNEDIDKLELAIKSLKGLISIGEEVMEDGKVDFADVNQIQPLIKEIKNVIDAAKAYKEIGAEAKDIDGLEASKLIALLFS